MLGPLRRKQQRQQLMMRAELTRRRHAMIARFAILLGTIAFPFGAWAQVGDTLNARDLAFHRMANFETPSELQGYKLNHLGIETRPSASGGHLVIASLEGYPAHTAGIERGDVLLTLDGEPFQPVTSLNPGAINEDFSEFIGSTDLEYRRGENIHHAEVTPVYENLYDSYRTATLNSVLSFAAGNKVIGYLRLWALTRETGDLITLRQVIESLSDTDGIVLDLRNSHGFLDAEHSDLFRANRRDFLEIAAADEDLNRLLRTRDRDDSLKAYRRPIAILIDSTTQGAAELLAHQLGKLERIITVGEPTLGKLGQWVHSEEGEVRSRHYLPASSVLVDGKTFEESGIIPEHPVTFPFEQTSRNDPQFQAAINLLMGVI